MADGNPINCVSPNQAGEKTKGGILPADCSTNAGQKIRIVQHTFTGFLWIAAWLFTIGFLHLTFWKGCLAILLWPYYIGVHYSALMR